jgi:hypothetical protein
MNNKKDVLSKKPPSKDFEIRCPRLGHQINFEYCQKENSGLPCFKTLDCWYNYFNVHYFFKEKLSREDFKKTFINRGQPKVHSLLDLIQKAKAIKGNKN